MEETPTGFHMVIVEPLLGLRCKEWRDLGDWPLCREAAERFLEWAVEQQQQEIIRIMRQCVEDMFS